MKAIMLSFMLCLMLPMSSTMTMEPTQPKTYQLSMMDQSVDDMYSGCTKEMDQKVQIIYFSREMKENELFQNAWNEAESCAKKKSEKISNVLLRALCVYTENKNRVYQDFNAAVRDSASKYSTLSFQYHALHFWLTSAIHILNPTKSCLTSYRRNSVIFTGTVNQVIRFGSFASTSKIPNILQYGNETCFHIKTCLGAYIKEYSVYEKEEEVLIPPYETFKITKTEKDSYQDLNNCKKIFVLESAGYLSKLNCKAAQQFDRAKL